MTDRRTLTTASDIEWGSTTRTEDGKDHPGSTSVRQQGASLLYMKCTVPTLIGGFEAPWRRVRGN